MLKNNQKLKKKRQWGTEKHAVPLPQIHKKPSTLKIALSRIAIVLTIIFWFMYVSSVILRQFIDDRASYQFTMEAFGYSFVVTLLTFSALMYLIMRQGAFQRFSKHIRVPRSLIDKHFMNNNSAITVLIPSYAEEVNVIRKTLLSAVLQEYPNITVVLLIDDDPNTTNPEKLAKLQATRALITKIKNLLNEPYTLLNKEVLRFKNANSKKKLISASIYKYLIKNYEYAIKWLNNLADHEEIEDHVDVFFAEEVIRKLANDLSQVRDALIMSSKNNVKLPKDRIEELYHRLLWIFKANLKNFERKEYISLSHEANKAMNLNAYIGLMGGRYSKEKTPDGIILSPANKKTKEDLYIPDSEFILTLDADSILLREYCLRLVYFLQQPHNAKVAITQTPYSSFRGAYSRIERLAGATTDIQHILHQGMSHYGATFWVGANAVIRKKALDDIVEKEWIGGFEIKRYIQDKTVIEDTESTIDLTSHGWKLINYPERLSYSATPSDFGSLVVQRRRWANGGLLILPKLLSQMHNYKNENKPFLRTEILLRLNYMASIAWASLGLIFLLAYPYDGRLLSPLVLLAALPYFIAMAFDLKYCGYKYSDIFRIYGFNLILLPVNLAGVIKSIEQALTGRKIPFARTPKVKNRTSTSLLYVMAPLLIVGFSVFTFWRNIDQQNWGNAAFAGFNALAAIWAIFAYIGINNLIVDIWLGLTEWLYVEYRPKNKKVVVKNNIDLDWKSIIY